MEKDQKRQHRFGLVGKDISYSFSEQYFTKKFERLNLEDHTYQNFDISSSENFPDIIAKEENLKGLNVTIPYKEEVLDYLHVIDGEAKKIGAVNTIKILENNRLKGFNTDVYGFETSLTPLLKKHHSKALILGTGGASKAVNYVLNKLDIEVLFVSRNPKSENEISYNDLTESILKSYTVIVNCTPIGTHPAVDECPNIPYKYITSNHLLFDLIYNPSRTLFLKKGMEKNAQVSNGFKMLELQAEKSWEIWNA
jgi:shikimate dehydrogenase